MLTNGNINTGFYFYGGDAGSNFHYNQFNMVNGETQNAGFFAPGTWHHFVVQCDGTTKELWCDGAFVDSSPGTDLVVGGSGGLQTLGNNSGSAVADWWDLGIVTRPMTQAEIEGIYSNTTRLPDVGAPLPVLKQHETTYSYLNSLNSQHETLYGIAKAQNFLESQYGVAKATSFHETTYTGGQAPVYQLDGRWFPSFNLPSVRQERTTRNQSPEIQYPIRGSASVTLNTETEVNMDIQPVVVPRGAIADSIFHEVGFNLRVGAASPITEIPFIVRLGQTIKTEKEFNQLWVLDVPMDERIFQMEWELITQDTELVEREFNQEWQIEAKELVEKEFNQRWGLGEVSGSFDQMWALPQWDWIPKILDLMNADRAAQGRTSFLKNWYGNFPELATRHARNMAETDIYAHESSGFPAGYETVYSRIKKLATPYSWASENIMFAAVISSNPEDYPYITPEQAFDFWRNSPGHYGNYTIERPEGSDLYGIVGLEFLVQGSGVEGYEDATVAYAVMKYIDLALYGGEPMIKEREFNQTYRVDSAIMEFHNAVWDTDAYVKVKAKHETGYAIKVAAQHETKMGLLVAAQHETLLMNSLTVLHETSYSQSVFLSWQHETLFGDSPNVLAQNQSEYGDAPRVRAQIETLYSDAPSVSKWHETQYDPSVVVKAQHESSWVLRQVAGRHHETKYGNLVTVTAQLETRFDINVTERVAERHSSFYTLVDDSPIISSNSVTVTLSGVSVEFDTLQVSKDEGELGWRGTVSLSEVADYIRAKKGDSVIVDMAGETYVLEVDTKSLNRADQVRNSMSLGLLSPVVGELSLNSSQVTRVQEAAISARDLVEDIIGRPVVWNILDWNIPAYRFAVRGVTKADAVERVVSACGGVLEAEPDGSLVVNYLYPVAMNAMTVEGADFVLTDEDDNLSQQEFLSGEEVINRIRIRELPSSLSDTIELVKSDDANDRGKLFVYPQPWRDKITVEPTINNGAVFLTRIGVQSRQETQEVEFIEGEASLEYPAVSIDVVEWHSASLGAVGGEARTPRVYASDTSVNYGYGLATITYTVEALVYEVQIPVGQSVQFIVVDTGG